MTLPAGTKIGPYEVVEQLGAGGMGVVYRAHDRRLHRDVAIKLLPLGALTDDDARARFHREALALATLSHPHIATLFDVGEHEGGSYLVMECVAGEPLSATLARGPLPVAQALALGVEIADALEEAHEHGIVHRDLKPANVIVTSKGHAKVLDFGLAKLLAPSESASLRASLTETKGAVGTLLYMSPEQAVGEPIDARTDIWSLGVLLYESLAGAPPFRGSGTLGVLHAITASTPDSLHAQRAEIPADVERAIARALAKDPSARYANAREMRDALSAALARLGAPNVVEPRRARRSRLSTLVPIGVAVVAIGASGGWYYERGEHRHWARDQAIPEIRRLQGRERPLAAFRVLQRARGYLLADSQLTALASTSVRSVTVLTTPPGATIEIADYVAGDSGWYVLGTTPIARAELPRGYMRWRVTSPTMGAHIFAPMRGDTMRFALDSLHAAPPGTVYAPGAPWGDFIAFVGWVGGFRLPPFYIDKYEVTNREYQQFVDAHGYERAEYWTERFTDAGRVLTREDAMTRLRDSTGRAGPSTWKGGHFPESQGDFPVAGVSWYEAAAYAAWAKKSLPAMAQWYYAAPPDVDAWTVRASNISRERVARVGAFAGVGPFGTYDMAGNVREWVVNPLADGRRLILGGAWSSQTYLFSEPEALSPFDRSATNGIRCVRNLAPMPATAVATITPLERDFTTVKPASDEVFRVYRAMYRYDRGPLDAKVDAKTSETGDWRKERVTFNTAYGDERMAAYLFLPKHVKPPYQTIVFFPSARVLGLNKSDVLGDTSFFDYVVQSGRAVMYPIYQDTYERQQRSALPGASQQMRLTIERYKDLARSLDYLATRADIDTSRIGYLGVSMGAAEGVIFTTLLQDRIKTDVFLDGGYFLDKPTEGRDQADFAPRLRIPVLMVNGRYDFSFSLERAQRPLFRMLGTPESKKKHVVLETPHDVRAKRPEMMAAVLEWLDTYLGAVK